MELTDLIKITSLIALLLLASCNSTTGNIVGEEVSNLHEVSLDIEGMTCSACASGVEYQLKQLDGVVDVQVSYLEAKGIVKYDADKLDAETIAQASDVYSAKIINDKVIY